MSIRIQSESCIGCGRCMEVCPGNLIKKDEDGKAYIRRPQDCWGCTSCIKECGVNAIGFYLGIDMGGRGSVLTVEKQGHICHWRIESPEGQVKIIDVDQRDSNNY